jgi:glycerol-3-phosphate O-acyltransferase/dihydroxyacetone phosphate acyltransferase
LVNVFNRVYYKFDYQGMENIPRGKPIILAPNHVNAFLDPVLIGMMMRREIRFFARGDVFKGTFTKWILDQLNISPVYRIQEGYSELKKNDKTFEECKRRLLNNEVILMFPEGICIQERRLRPLKKGLARIVFQTAASVDFNKDILILPVGINYTDAKRFRSKVVIDFGKPLSILAYKESFAADPAKTINEFTKVLENKMKPQLVIIDSPENEILVAAIEEIFMKQWIESKSGNPSDLKQQYKASKEIAAMVNTLTTTHPELIESLRLKTEAYIQKLNTFNLRDHLLDPAAINKMNLFSFLKDSLIIYLGMPLYAIALLFNFPPYYIAKRVSDTRIKNVEFYASVYSNLAMIIWLVYYGFQLVIVGLLVLHWPLLAVYALIVPLLGFFAIRFNTVMKKIRGRWRLLRMVRKERDTAAELINERKSIVEAFQEAKKTANF